MARTTRPIGRDEAATGTGLLEQQIKQRARARSARPIHPGAPAYEGRTPYTPPSRLSRFKRASAPKGTRLLIALHPTAPRGRRRGSSRLRPQGYPSGGPLVVEAWGRRRPMPRRRARRPGRAPGGHRHLSPRLALRGGAPPSARKGKGAEVTLHAPVDSWDILSRTSRVGRQAGAGSDQRQNSAS